MKANQIKYFIYACLFMGWTGCSSEPDPCLFVAPDHEVVFRIDRENDLMTKAAEMGFRTGDSIGIYAVRRTDPGQVALPGQSGNQAHNAKWIKTAEGWLPASLADKIVYPQDGAKLDFYAYYPYSRNGQDPENFLFTVKLDQAQEKNRSVSDFMVACNKEGINEGEVSLVFAHALAMVEVEVKEIAPESVLEVQLSGIQTGAYLDFGTDQFTPVTTTETIDMFRVETAEGATTYTYRAYVPAQSVPAQTALFNCVLNGKVYIYKSEGVTLTRGNRTRFELSLK